MIMAGRKAESICFHMVGRAGPQKRYHQCRARCDDRGRAGHERNGRFGTAVIDLVAEDACENATFAIEIFMAEGNRPARVPIDCLG
jgi:hypothetical protein